MCVCVCVFNNNALHVCWFRIKNKRQKSSTFSGARIYFTFQLLKILWWFFKRHGQISFDVFSQLYIFTLPLTHTSSLSFPFICISALPLWPNHSSLHHHHHHVTLSKSPAVIYSSLFGWFHQLNTRRSRWADAMSWKEPDPITCDLRSSPTSPAGRLTFDIHSPDTNRPAQRARDSFGVSLVRGISKQHWEINSLWV